MISTEIGSACVFFKKSKPNHISHFHIFHYLSNDTNVCKSQNGSKWSKNYSNIYREQNMQKLKNKQVNAIADN